MNQAATVDAPARKRPITDMQSLFREIGGGALLGAVQSALDQMAIAEEEIKHYTDRFPGNHVDIRRAFVQLRWMLKMPVPESVYRAHVQELLTRVVNDQSLMRGTRAEVLMLLSEASRMAPLRTRYVALYLKLFDKLYPQAFAGQPPFIQEPWIGSSDELLEALRHEAKADRRLD